MVRPAVIYYNVQGFQGSTLEYLRQHFELIVEQDPEHVDPEAFQRAAVIFAPMGFLFGKERIDRCPNLAVIATPTTATLHIDMDYAALRGIRVCSLKDQQVFLATITCTAELTWGLLLAVTRHLLPAYESLLKGEWKGPDFGRKTPRMLSAMSLGVIGLGRLGSWVARYGKAFGMRVSYYDPYVVSDQFIRHTKLPDLAHSSDIVSVHAHLTPETEGLVDAKFIQNMPKGAYLINTARGGIVDEKALLDALRSGHLAGAGLDMLAGEHLPGFGQRLGEHPLVEYARTHDNLIITPKIGGCTVDAWEKTEHHIVENIILALKEKGLI